VEERRSLIGGLSLACARPFAENYYLFVAADETTRKTAPLLFYASLMTSILQLTTTK